MTPWRNLTLYRLPPAFAHGLNPSKIDAALGELPMVQPGPLEYERSGFYPLAQLGGAYTQRIGDRVLFCHATSRRLLPGPVIAEALRQRIAEIELAEGKTPGPRERRRIRDEIVVKLLPQAFVQASYTHAVIDLTTGWVWVDSATTRKADAVISELREALGSFPALPIHTDHSVRATLTSWLFASESPFTHDLTIGTAAVLAEPVEQGSRINARHQEMFSDEIGAHLAAGKQVEQLELSLGERVSFAVDDKLNIKHLVFTDDALDVQDSDGEAAARDALGTATLVLAELAQIVRVIEVEFEPSEAL